MENQLLNMKEELSRRIKIAEGDIERFEVNVALCLDLVYFISATYLR